MSEIEFKSSEHIITEEFAKRNFFLKGLVYAETDLGKTYLAISSFLMDREEETYMYIFPTDTIENIDEVLKQLLNEKQLERVFVPRDEDGRMIPIKTYKDIIKRMRDVMIWYKEHQNDESRLVVLIDNADGIEEIYINSFFATLGGKTPQPVHWGKARTNMLNEFVVPLMDMKADVVFISSEQDLYPEGDDAYAKPVGVTDCVLGGGGKKSRDKFKKKFNLIFNLQERFPTDVERRCVVNVIKKIKLADEPKQWMKAIELYGHDCNDMRRIYKEILYRQKQSRENKDD